MFERLKKILFGSSERPRGKDYQDYDGGSSASNASWTGAEAQSGLDYLPSGHHDAPAPECDSSTESGSVDTGTCDAGFDGGGDSGGGGASGDY